MDGVAAGVVGVIGPPAPEIPPPQGSEGGGKMDDDDLWLLVIVIAALASVSMALVTVVATQS